MRLPTTYHLGVPEYLPTVSLAIHFRYLCGTLSRITNAIGTLLLVVVHYYVIQRKMHCQAGK